MVKPIFKNNALQQQFETDGFVKITLLSAENIIALKTLFNHYFPNPSADFFSSSYENDYPRKKKISDAIGEILLPQLETIFIDYTWFGSAFLSKGNGLRSEMPMHQDWTIVDETKYIALNIWTPLQTTTEENGTLEVIKGSHKWHNTFRAPTLPFYFDGYQSQLKEKLTVIPTLATEAIVLNQAIIHYSKANKTNDTRIAITTGIKSKDAPMIFHYWNKEVPNEIEQFKQEDDFLLQFNDFHKDIFKRPQLGESIGKLAFQKQQATEKEIQNLVQPKIATKKFTSKFIQWLKG
jgi:Phytanoyl-CoA dioxygenase (PhyH)